MIPAAWRAGEVAVLGLGRSGTAAAQWLVGQGVRVYASDLDTSPALRPTADRLTEMHVSVELGMHDLDRIGRAAAVIVSPGIPPQVEALAVARDAGVEVLAEIELAVRNMPDTSFVVVTGTNGKTTTTALIEHLLRSADIDAAAAGNIGEPLMGYVDRRPPLAWCVLEASSFQLHDAPSVAPAVGVLTNLAPDHQDRYERVEEYYADKRRLFRNAGGASHWVLNGDDPAVLEMAAGVPGHHHTFSLRNETDAWYDRAAGLLRFRGESLVPRDRIALMGDHNVANALAASLAARAVGVGAESIASALTTFAAVPHRLETVGTRDGVQWVNDSKATNVASAGAALSAMHGGFVWMAGGRDKGEDFAPLREHLTHCRGVVAYGESGPAIAATFQGAVPVVLVESLADAVAAVAALAQPGDVGLLSPGCTSFDQFDDFEHRGDMFRRLVRI